MSVVLIDMAQWAFFLSQNLISTSFLKISSTLRNKKSYNNFKVSSNPQYLSVSTITQPSRVCGKWNRVTGHI